MDTWMFSNPRLKKLYIKLKNHHWLFTPKLPISAPLSTLWTLGNPGFQWSSMGRRITYTTDSLDRWQFFRRRTGNFTRVKRWNISEVDRSSWTHRRSAFWFPHFSEISIWPLRTKHDNPGIQSYSQMMNGMFKYLSILFRFQYYFQVVDWIPGWSIWKIHRSSK